MDDTFHKSASISDKITALGNLEHVYYHAKKSAGVKIEDKEAEIFFQTVAAMAQDFRRRYMKKHFPDCPEELWCLGKAVEIARQRIYESDKGDTEDISDIDAIWQMIWGRITGQDLSGCSACREDSGYEAGEMVVEEPQDDKVKARLKIKPDGETVLELHKWYLISAELWHGDDKSAKGRIPPNIAVNIYGLDGKYLTYREFPNVETLKAFWDFGGKYPREWDIELAAADKDYETSEMTVEEAKKQFQTPSL